MKMETGHDDLPTYRKLKLFYRRFIDEWVACGNRTVALRKLRPKVKSHKELSYKLAQNPRIMQAFAERSASFEKETTEHLHAVKRKIANAANARRIGIRGPKGEILPVEEWPEGVEDCVEGFKCDDTGKIIEVKLAPLVESRRLYLESQKQLVRRNSLEDPNGRPLNPGVARLMVVTQEEADKLDSELDAEV